MSNLEPTKEGYDSLIYKLATQESELGQARKLLEATAKAGWWRRFWGRGSAAALVLLVVVIGAGVVGAAPKYITGNAWLKCGRPEKVVYMEGFQDGAVVWRSLMEKKPKEYEALWQCCQSWPPSQTLAVVEKYLKDNPQQWDKPIFLLIQEAIEDACQKKG
jgi:hypothetical protein